jgi:hypothetical protein
MPRLGRLLEWTWFSANEKRVIVGRFPQKERRLYAFLIRRRIAPDSNSYAENDTYSRQVSVEPREPAGFASTWPPLHLFLVYRELFMMDVVMLAIGVAFFALSIGYVYACDLL